MENTASLGKRALAWIVLIAAALLALKLAWGAVFGLIQLVFTLVILVAVGMAVLWAVRRL